jgi:hypothetical protein
VLFPHGQKALDDYGGGVISVLCPRRSRIFCDEFVQYSLPPVGKIEGLHNILNSLWTVLRNIDSVTVSLPSSKHVPSTIIPVDCDVTVNDLKVFKSMSCGQKALRDG